MYALLVPAEAGTTRPVRKVHVETYGAMEKHPFWSSMVAGLSLRRLALFYRKTGFLLKPQMLEASPLHDNRVSRGRTVLRASV